MRSGGWRRLVPGPLRTRGRHLADYLSCLLRDVIDAARGKRADPLVPPTRLMFDGSRDAAGFLAVGAEFARLFRELGGLKPDDAVLDVGSGIGRMARGLVPYLSERGTYEGFDIGRPGVDWCRRKITPRHPNFGFRHVDVYNSLYNPRGTIPARELVFPFADATFDFVMLTSVFTHMLPRDVRQYARQVARVLRPGGRAFVTMFLIDEVSLRLLEEGKSSLAFGEESESVYRVVDPTVPEFAVAYDTRWALDLFRGVGLEPRAPYPGVWSGRPRGTTYQDVVVSTKPPE